jgi:hypothetical protein
MKKAGRPKLKALDPVEYQVAKRLYVNDEWTIRKIAKALSCSYWEVRNVLLKQGIKLRKRGRQKHEA